MAATPVFDGPLLIVASLDRNLHALTLEPGPRVAWKRTFRGGFDASPIVHGDRLILAETGSTGRLIALDRASRNEAWSLRVGDVVGEPVVASDRIYLVTSTGRVVAVTDQGVELWRIELETRVFARPVLLGHTLVIAAADGHLFALDPVAGSVRERRDAGAGPIWGDPVVLEEERPPLAIYATVGGQVVAVTGDLEVVARRSFPSSFFAGPHSDAGTLYLAGHEGTVWAYDWREAEVLWRREVPGILRATPAVGPRAVTAGDLGGGLHFLDRETGEPLWRTRLDGAVTAMPLTAGPIVYVATERGSLYAFRPTGSP